MKYSSPLFTLIITLAWGAMLPCGFAASQASLPTSPQPGPVDPGWPREITRNGVRLVYYQPQVDEWKDLRELRARIAFVLTPNNEKPAVGLLEVQGNTHTDLKQRTVFIDDIKIINVRFPSLSDAEEAKMQELFKTTFPGRPLTVSLDRLIACVQASDTNAKSVNVKTDPPPIFVSTEPAILLTVEGDPILAPIKGLQLKFVLNANWDLFFVPEDSRYYLLADKTWLTKNSLSGNWELAGKLPSDLSNLPSGENWEHVRKGAEAWAGEKSKAKAPQVFFSAVPAELIAFAGDPVYKKIAGTQLSYATNTDSWIFTGSGDGQVYYLVAGRWFRADSLQGPWTYAGNDLPQDFQKIPPEGEPGAVLASVPGTSEAQDAVLLAKIPTTAVVKRTEAEAQAKAEYDGDPRFVPIEGTALSYAANADADVIKVEETYYLCQNAVWFSSRSPTGPWTIVTSVPDVIYTIPPSSPVYHVTYVKVEGSNQDEVTCSYTAGYAGAYIAGAAGTALVWGTGYYYPPYTYTGLVPYYRPYYATYGVAATYYPYAGVYAVGGYAYGPYASAGRAAWYNPQTGGYGRAYTTQTPYGGRTYAWGYNPSTGTSWTTQQGHGYYGQWGKSTVTRGGETYQAGHVVTQYGQTGVVKGPDNLYAGHDGNVYKRDDNGNWSKWDNGGWQPVNPQGNLSSQNRGNANQNLSNAGSNQGNLGATNQPPGKGQANAKSGTGKGNRGEGSQPQQAGSDRKSKQAGRQKGNEYPANNRTAQAGTKRSGSNELTSGLDREASARRRGSQNVNLQQRYQERETHRFQGFRR
jgi:hypothetical protein